jgi:hypothetical protein
MADLGKQLRIGLTPREVIELSTDLGVFTQDRFFSNPGKPLRELAAAASYCFALLGAGAEQVVLRTCSVEPPDVEMEMPQGRQLIEVVTLLDADARPHADARRLENYWAAVAAAKTLSERVELLNEQRRPLEVETSDEDRDAKVKLLEQAGIFAIVNSPATRREELSKVVDKAREQLRLKSRKYAGRGTSFGLLIHSLMSSRLPQSEPAAWRDWLSEEDKLAAELFPQICLVRSNSIHHEALAFRERGVWLDTPIRYAFTDPAAKAKFQSELESLDERLTRSLGDGPPELPQMGAVGS